MNTVLFFKVWGNIFLKDLIIKFIRLHENKTKTFKTIEDIKNYPYLDYIQTLVYKGDQIITEKCLLPQSGYLSTLCFDSVQLNRIPGEVIPNSVKEIRFYRSFNFELLSDIPNINLFELPSSISTILNYYHKPTIINSNNNNNNNNNNQNIEIIELPSNIKSISLSYLNCNIPLIINSIGNCLTKIEFPQNWNNGDKELIGNCFPNSILIFIANGYRSELKLNVLPNSITNLSIGAPIDYTLNFSVLPINLKILSIGFFDNTITINNDSFSQSSLSSLKEIKIVSKNLNLHPFSLPLSIEKLTITSLMGNISPFFIKKEILSSNSPESQYQLLNLKSLTVVQTGYNHFEFDSFSNCKNLLKFKIAMENKCDDYKEDIKYDFVNYFSFPESLTSLHLGIQSENNTQLLPNKLPSSLKKLIFENSNKPFSMGSLPIGLTELDVGSNWNHDLLPNLLPSTLKTLKLGHKFNKPLIKNSLPFGLESLIFSNDSRFSQPICEKEIFPQSLTELVWGDTYLGDPIPDSLYPISLIKIKKPISYLKKISNSVNSTTIAKDGLTVDKQVQTSQPLPPYPPLQDLKNQINETFVDLWEMIR